MEDDGPGIPSDLLSKVQEPFFSTKHGGTGLGLAICRSLAWQNGGRLEIDERARRRHPASRVELRLTQEEAVVEEVLV